MRPIGFSTGALAKGDFTRGVELQRQAESISAIELSALRDHELQVHVSDVGPHGEHGSIGALAQLAFSRVAPHIPNTCPLIIESIIEFDRMAEELEAVKQVFDRPETIREGFGDLWAVSSMR